MKQYIKDGQISGEMIIIDSRQVYNPTEEMLLAEGYAEYTPQSADEVLVEEGYEIREVEIPETEVIEEGFVEEGIEQPIENEVVETQKKTYEQRVVELIRLHYSVDDELAILRQRDTKTEEFEEYNSYCENCKTIARVEFGLQEVKEVPVTEEPIEDIVEPNEE